MTITLPSRRMVLLYMNFRRMTETGVVMLIYLERAWERIRAGRGRPKMMTVVAIMAGLLPIMWSTGTGSEVMRRIAAPLVGGMISSTILTLAVIPAIYSLVKGRGLPARTNATTGEAK